MNKCNNYIPHQYSKNGLCAQKTLTNLGSIDNTVVEDLYDYFMSKRIFTLINE